MTSFPHLADFRKPLWRATGEVSPKLAASGRVALHLGGHPCSKLPLFPSMTSTPLTCQMARAGCWCGWPATLIAKARRFPSMRTLAASARKSLATICRWLKQLLDRGCFTRTREAGRVYHYTLAEPYRLRWRERPKSAGGQGVSPPQEGVSQRARQEADPTKDEESARAEMKWRARAAPVLRGTRWVASYGPPPGDWPVRHRPHLPVQWPSQRCRLAGAE